MCKAPLCEFDFNSRSEEGNEDDFGEDDEEVHVQENSEWHEKGNQQVNGHQDENAEYGDGVRGKNSNVVGKQRSKWWRVECNLVDDNGVFITKGQVVACGPHETILNDQLGEDHVGLWILYCHGIVLTWMIIWKWLLAQMIFDE